jgi:ADP-heptose:LPS heptosyltransferase
MVIGLSWISKAPVGGEAKSARLMDFEPLLRTPGRRFVDLQYGDTRDERLVVERELGVPVERLDDIDNTNDLDGLAALMCACDAVVTVSNTTAHLAGALGVPTWVMVPHGQARIWYWFRDKDDSPWYPRVRVRRQQRGQPWREVVAAVAREVAGAVTGGRR